jgi:transformation/transcription domain-associated protein
VDPAIFLEVFSSQINYFYELVKSDAALLAVPQYVLATELVSRNLASVLLTFLMSNERFEELGNASQPIANILLRLFKMVFTSVTLYPDLNESVLQPHMSDLITKSLKYAAKAKEPNNYFMLLRALFRNIGGGRYESLYKEVLPLLPFLLKNLNTLLVVSEKPAMRDLFVELCLTVPVRLSVLLYVINCIFLSRSLFKTTGLICTI